MTGHMRRRYGKTARILWLVGFVAWLCVIWGHSLMPAEQSSSESARALVVFQPLFDFVGITDPDFATFLVRKLAHFSEYAMLGVLSTGMMRAWVADDALAYRLCAIPWILVPCIDEVIQLFVPGRDGRITDVVIDMAGGMLGMLIANAVVRKRNKNVGGG